MESLSEMLCKSRANSLQKVLLYQSKVLNHKVTSRKRARDYKMEIQNDKWRRKENRADGTDTSPQPESSES